MIEPLRNWARGLKRETLALYLAYRDPRSPWYARVVAACVVAYALSPIDLIPDFIPLLGLLDDLILLPLGIALALRLIPPQVMAESRERAATLADRPISRVGIVAIALIWLMVAGVGIWWLVRLWQG